MRQRGSSQHANDYHAPKHSESRWFGICVTG